MPQQQCPFCGKLGARYDEEPSPRPAPAVEFERIGGGVFLLWVAVLSLVLMHGEGQEGTRAERE